MIFATLFVILALLAAWYFFLGGKDMYPLLWDRITTTQQPRPEPAPPPRPIDPPPAPPPPPPVEEPVRIVPAPEPLAPQELTSPTEPLALTEPLTLTEPVIIAAPVAPPPVRPQTVERTRPQAPVSSYRVPAVIPRNGAPYQLRWGDTLWDISEAFYRDPWLFPQIARFNNIPNPDHIIAGRTIRIPPRN